MPRVRGWSGGARQEFSIGLNQATPGYQPGRLAPGIGLFSITPGSRSGLYGHDRNRVYLQDIALAEGDLHTHSVHSDGTYTLEENAAMMESLAIL